ncbi:hypothetical protein EV121DRAFT_261060 [Schizophyllum commune]
MSCTDAHQSEREGAPACSCPGPSGLNRGRLACISSVEEEQPAETDTTALDASIAAIDAQIAVHRAHIASLERDRAQLVEVKRREQLTEAEHCMQALRSPILRLPRELLELIIRAALPPEWSTAVSGTIRFPLLQSCRRIRAIAHTMPEIWCTIVLPPDQYLIADKFYDVAQRYLARAQPLPIHLVDPTKQYRQDARLDRWMVEHMNRFRTATWCMHLANLPPTKVAAPSLESAMFLATYRTGAADTTPSGLLTIVDAPLLRTVTIGVFLPLAALELPWAQLTELHVRIFRFRPENLHVFQSCVSLSTLNVSVEYEFALPECHPIALNSLRTLKLGDYATLLAPRIVTPVLTDLSICISTQQHWDPVHDWTPRMIPISTWLRNSTPPSSLHALTVTGLWRSSHLEDLKDVFLLLPTIDHLSLSCRESGAAEDHDLLKAIILLDDTAILPNLEHLSLQIEDGAFETMLDFGTALKKFALCRWANGGARPTGRLTFRSLACEKRECRCYVETEWLETLKAEGILVYRPTCT